MSAGSRNIVLIADDFAISEGVSEGIAQLAHARRLSGTSALVTLPRWLRDGVELAALRDHVAIGLHVNLTLGAPLGPMRGLAPSRVLPDIGTLIKGALTRRIDQDEVEAEISRQLVHFADITGHKPDFIDGHQHTHALPVIRGALIAAVARFYRDGMHKPLIRVPGDTLRVIMSRPGARAKALLLAGLSAGFSSTLATAGLPANDSFAGVTGFGASDADVRRDLAAAAQGSGRLHLVMCHPGQPSAELAELDPITTRRAAELAVLAQDNVLSPRLWHPDRHGADGAIDWQQLAAGT